MTRRLFWRACRSAIGFLVVCSIPALSEVRAERFAGKPAFSEGKALGYFVWRDDDTWKVRWTTFGAEHHFTGRVMLEGGEIRSLKRVDADTERRVIRPGLPPRPGPRGRLLPGRRAVVATAQEDRIEQETERLIRFATRTDDDIDGFDFKVSSGTSGLRLVLESDGKPRSGEVEVGRENFKPNENPLVVLLR